MEVLFKKDLNKSYMVLKEAGNIEKDFRVQIMCNNTIPGIIPLDIKQFNNKEELYYDVSGKVSFENMYIINKMKANNIRTFVMGMQVLAENLEEYLLDIDKILFNTHYIYINPTTGIPEFCYYPNNQTSFLDSLKGFSNEILKITDHKDREAVILSYGIQQISMQENFTINELVKLVSKGNNLNRYEKSYKDKGLQYELENKNYGNNKVEEISQSNKEEKKNFWSAVKSIFFKRSVYVVSNELPDELKKYSIHEFEKDYEDEEYADYEVKENADRLNKWRSVITEDEEAIEEETILLKTDVQSFGIILRSLDLERAQTIIPNDFPCIVGKSVKSSDYIIEDNTISRVHLRVNENTDGYYIEDLNSTNGTYINEERIRAHEPRKIEIGDKITLAGINFIVE